MEPEFYGIVFSRTRTGADEIVAKLLERGYAAEVLHGDISQAQREKILGKFKKKQVNILVATDVAARGHRRKQPHARNQLLAATGLRQLCPPHRTHGPRRQPGTAITFISPPRCANSGS